MDDTERKRAILSWVYPGEKWLNKVIAMSSAQVHAVYNHMSNHGRLKGIASNVKIRTSS